MCAVCCVCNDAFARAHVHLQIGTALHETPMLPPNFDLASKSRPWAMCVHFCHTSPTASTQRRSESGIISSTDQTTCHLTFEVTSSIFQFVSTSVLVDCVHHGCTFDPTFTICIQSCRPNIVILKLLVDSMLVDSPVAVSSSPSIAGHDVPRQIPHHLPRRCSSFDLRCIDLGRHVCQPCYPTPGSSSDYGCGGLARCGQRIRAPLFIWLLRPRSAGRDRCHNQSVGERPHPCISCPTFAVEATRAQLLSQVLFCW